MPSDCCVSSNSKAFHLSSPSIGEPKGAEKPTESSAFCRTECQPSWPGSLQHSPSLYHRPNCLHDSLQLILNQTQLTGLSSCPLALHLWEAKEDETDGYLRWAPTAIQKLILNLSSLASLLFTVNNSCYTESGCGCMSSESCLGCSK